MPAPQPPAGPTRGQADDRDDSSKTTPASDMQGDDTLSPGLSGDLGADGTPAAGEQRRGERREQGPGEARSSKAMKQESRTGEDR